MQLKCCNLKLFNVIEENFSFLKFKILKKVPGKSQKKGILLKFPKSNQDLRVDLPTVGIKTINKCSKIGLKGVVVKANQNILLDKSKCIKIANKKNMFICAI